MEMSVANAAPRMPHLKPNRNSGASITLISAPIMLVYMALAG